jgi:hypothetical protein
LLLVILSGVTAAPSPGPAATQAFHKLQSLSGEWQGTDQHGMAAQTTFKLDAGKTVVVETLSPSGMEPMLTLYSLDGEAITLVHYCPTNNQPRMRAVPAADPVRELTFEFTGAGNLPDEATGHQHRLVIRFDDDNRLTESWTWRANGKDTLMVYHFARRSGPSVPRGSERQHPQ